MLTIRLFCAAGMSTSLLVRKMNDAAKERGISVDIVAYPVNELDQHLKGADVVLLAPQIRYRSAAIIQELGSMGIPCAMIDMRSYGMVDGKTVMDLALSITDKR